MLRTSCIPCCSCMRASLAVANACAKEERPSRPGGGVEPCGGMGGAALWGTGEGAVAGSGDIGGALTGAGLTPGRSCSGAVGSAIASSFSSCQFHDAWPLHHACQSEMFSCCGTSAIFCNFLADSTQSSQASFLCEKYWSLEM